MRPLECSALMFRAIGRTTMKRTAASVLYQSDSSSSLILRGSPVGRRLCTQAPLRIRPRISSVRRLPPSATQFKFRRAYAESDGKSMSRKTLLPTVLVWGLLAEARPQAYLDPGSGSMLLQILLEASRRSA